VPHTPNASQAVDLTPEAVDFDLTDRAPNEIDIRLGQRAVIVHQAESWEHGEYCRNCHAPFPCRLARWGRRALMCAGYTEPAVAALIARSTTPPRPWLLAKAHLPGDRAHSTGTCR
jgi:hypothetical protein